MYIDGDLVKVAGPLFPEGGNGAAFHEGRLDESDDLRSDVVDIQDPVGILDILTGVRGALLQ